ncbi:MAG: hypothetical protein QM703_07860 [Gemmatales bacterium]
MGQTISMVMFSASLALMPLTVRADDPKVVTAVKVEFRRAETKLGKGLVEAVIQGKKEEKVYLHPNAELTHQDIESAFVDSFGSSANEYMVQVAFTKEGARKMTALSKEHLHKPLAILIDGKVVSAPVIASELSNGCVIAGNFKKEEAERIAKQLSAQRK